MKTNVPKFSNDLTYRRISVDMCRCAHVKHKNMGCSPECEW